MSTMLQELTQGYRRGFGQVLDDRTPFLGNFKPGQTPLDTIGYTGGRLVGDFATDSSRTPYWRYNAPQAIANETGQKIARKAGLDPKKALVAGAVLTGGMELATGNVNPFNISEAGRPKGYSALFPKEIEVEVTDPETGLTTTETTYDLTKSRNPIAEMPVRYFMGRTGGLLPYDELVKERPNVTPEEYQRYQAARRDHRLFGLENSNTRNNTILGAVAGGAASALTKGRIDPRLSMPAGAIAGFGTAGTADAVSEIGLLRGTRESLDDPVGEFEFFGYRIPIAKTAIAGALGAAGLYGASKALKTGQAQSLVNKVSNKLGQGDLMAPVAYQPELDFTYGGARSFTDMPEAVVTNKDLETLRRRNQK